MIGQGFGGPDSAAGQRHYGMASGQHEVSEGMDGLEYPYRVGGMRGEVVGEGMGRKEVLRGDVS